jgi:hypothetical protein
MGLRDSLILFSVYEYYAKLTYKVLRKTFYLSITLYSTVTLMPYKDQAKQREAVKIASREFRERKKAESEQFIQIANDKKGTLTPGEAVKLWKENKFEEKQNDQ